MNKHKTFPGVLDGQIFTVAGIEFIKFRGAEGKTPVVAKNNLFTSKFGGDNNLSESIVLKRLQREILPKIIAEVGEENVCEFETDLTALDGLKPYNPLKSSISLPTLDFYRANVDVFDQHPSENWWWLATPESAPPHCEARWVLCVSPSGNISFNNNRNYDDGVRPFLIFKSSIFESSRE